MKSMGKITCAHHKVEKQSSTGIEMWFRIYEIFCSLWGDL